MENSNMQLIQSITKDNDFFKQMVDMVPPQFYFTKETQDRLRDGALLKVESKFKGNGKWKGLSEKAKLKKAHYDPHQPKTVSQVANELENWSDDEEETVVHKPQNIKKRKRKNSESIDLKSSSETIEELRLSLQNRLASMKAKRHSQAIADTATEIKIQKRKEKKLRKKLKKKAEKEKLVKLQKAPVNGKATQKKPKGSPTKPIFNKEGKMVFSKFDFTESTKEEKPTNQGKDYKRILQKVQREKDKIDMLSVTQPEKAKVVKEKSVWKSVLQKAEGVKVRDDPELLKKAVKRKEKQKERVKKDWSERNEKVKEKMERKQDRRKKNIKARKQSKVNSKVGKAKKKGRIVPGF